mmetsp:Transcript_27385/g.27618  ORF Transcript_27385/g.27618 Transcript_27385/m.27618 type:complete len:114 (-) Transcript_27385:217-558(-)
MEEGPLQDMVDMTDRDQDKGRGAEIEMVVPELVGEVDTERKTLINLTDHQVLMSGRDLKEKKISIAVLRLQIETLDLDGIPTLMELVHLKTLEDPLKTDLVDLISFEDKIKSK